LFVAYTTITMCVTILLLFVSLEAATVLHACLFGGCFLGAKGIVVQPRAYMEVAEKDQRQDARPSEEAEKCWL
jgi:hypothetical protein